MWQKERSGNIIHAHPRKDALFIISQQLVIYSVMSTLYLEWENSAQVHLTANFIWSGISLDVGIVLFQLIRTTMIIGAPF